MTIKRKSLKPLRVKAFLNQRGCCYYCKQPMWLLTPVEVMSRYKITAGQAKQLMCTGEHIMPHSDGGDSTENNIVAACFFCNSRRHRRNSVPTPDQFKLLVHSRISRGKWHGVRLEKNTGTDHVYLQLSINRE